MLFEAGYNILVASLQLPDTTDYIWGDIVIFCLLSHFQTKSNVYSGYFKGI